MTIVAPSRAERGVAAIGFGVFILFVNKGVAT
jgi:hypothetical protein